MTDKKKYKKICKKYRKELKKIAKETYPWDYCFMMNYFETCLNFMKEYYTLGYNVWAKEKCETFDNYKNVPTRLDSITKALDEYNAYYNMSDKYYILHHKEEENKTNKKASLTNEMSNCWIECLIKDEEKNREAYIKESKEHWDAFWNTVKDNIQGWWD